MTARRGWGWPDQHLALDALVAFVDGELTPSAYDRAAAHLARCPACAAEATAQRQVRSAVRSASSPGVSPELLRALQAIPQDAQLPDQPDELAVAEDGRLVAVNARDGGPNRRVLGVGPLLGTSRPIGGNQQPMGSAPPLGSGGTGQAQTAEHTRWHPGRKTKQGAGVVFSGLVLGALAFMNVPFGGERPAPSGQWPGPGGRNPHDMLVTPASTYPPRTGPAGAPPPTGVPSRTTAATTSPAGGPTPLAPATDG